MKFIYSIISFLGRSLAACELLYNAGYTNLFWVQGGLEAAEDEVHLFPSRVTFEFQLFFYYPYVSFFLSFFFFLFCTLISQLNLELLILVILILYGAGSCHRRSTAT